MKNKKRLTLQIFSVVISVWINSCTKKNPAPEVATIIATHYRVVLLNNLEYDSSIILFDHILSTLDPKERREVETNQNLVKIISGNPKLMKPNDPLIIVKSNNIIDFVIQKNGLVITQKHATSATGSVVSE